MKIYFKEPIEPLKNYVKYFWHTNFERPNHNFFKYNMMADSSPGLIFHHDNGNATISERDGSKLPNAFLYGPSNKPCSNFDNGNSFLYGVVFQPMAIKSLFNIDANLMKNNLLNLDNFIEHNITDKLLNSKKLESIELIFNTLIKKQIRRVEKEDFLIKKSLELIFHNTENQSISNLSSSLKISKRQFERRFNTFVGIPPANYIRVSKFQKSLNLLLTGKYQKLSDIAYQFGYTDQSHFIKEFKSFSGFKPKDLSKNENSQCNFHLLTERIILN
ncbi:AraC-like DNA-binding protein [Gillisia sp. Hel_I_86]|uniref:helix-turn-helix transcriptional regulator n=1 Tax=Gillisia sp. Hel_I_86 TaxID=1249981 RepID=UPI00119AA5DD|nr:helix-turn-helix transcriptional regulator [Gillisia sp. Hel_I_86]TVZ26066.1 AraC-like DNA-binding protein [Gillisia sp. Hel_I_86]